MNYIPQLISVLSWKIRSCPSTSIFHIVCSICMYSIIVKCECTFFNFRANKSTGGLTFFMFLCTTMETQSLLMNILISVCMDRYFSILYQKTHFLTTIVINILMYMYSPVLLSNKKVCFSTQSRITNYQTTSTVDMIHVQLVTHRELNWILA